MVRYGLIGDSTRRSWLNKWGQAAASCKEGVARAKKHFMRKMRGSLRPLIHPSAHKEIWQRRKNQNNETKKKTK